MADRKLTKFDFVVGNPPYQDENRRQLYPAFYQSAKKIGDCVDMIFPTGWQEPKTGNNLKIMNTDEVKKDKQIILIDNVHNVFNGVKGAEWTNIIIWKNGYDNKLDGKQKILTEGVNPVIKELPMEWDRLPQLTNILDKVKQKKETSIFTIIHLQTKLNLEILFKDFPGSKEKIGSGGKDKRIVTNSFDVLPIFTDTETAENKILIYGTSKRNRILRYVNKKYLDNKNNAIEKYKVLLPAAGHGVINEKEAMNIISQPFIGEPNVGFSQSFIAFGMFNDTKELKSLIKYIKTKFFRTMVGTLKISQHNHADVFKNVPLQDFTDKSDIDWSKSIKEIDQQLYKKYGLSEDEIKFIEEKVKEMA